LSRTRLLGGTASRVMGEAMRHGTSQECFHTAVLRSFLLSVLVSFGATIAARHILALNSCLEAGGERRQRVVPPIVVVVPIAVGCSNNRIGWITETHHHHTPVFRRCRA
jgi:hypothetical protein